MFRVGLISDTHGIVDKRAINIFTGVSHIIHAGDIGSEDVLQELGKIARVVAVRGNTDTGSLACCPIYALVELSGLRVFVTHILGRSAGMKSDVLRAILAGHPNVVVYGHTHSPATELEKNKILFVNPGSAGPRRPNLPRTVADLVVEEDSVTVNFYDLEDLQPGRIMESRRFVVPW